MTRSDWSGLPAEVRQAIERRTGGVTGVDLAERGEHSDITATVSTPSGRVFLKGVRANDEERTDLWSLRREIRVAPHVEQLAPRLLWSIEAGGWLLGGWEHIDGRHADFSPGSPDLELVAQVVARLHDMPRPEVVRLDLARRWVDYALDISPFQGEALTHADINPGNLIITADRVYLVDWGFVGKAAPWVELSFLVQWLISAGHTPEQADAWLSRFPWWRSADPKHVDHLAEINARRWRDLWLMWGRPTWAWDIVQWCDWWAKYRFG